MRLDVVVFIWNSSGLLFEVISPLPLLAKPATHTLLSLYACIFRSSHVSNMYTWLHTNTVVLISYNLALGVMHYIIKIEFRLVAYPYSHSFHPCNTRQRRGSLSSPVSFFACRRHCEQWTLPSPCYFNVLFNIPDACAWWIAAWKRGWKNGRPHKNSSRSHSRMLDSFPVHVISLCMSHTYTPPYARPKFGK